MVMVMVMFMFMVMIRVRVRVAPPRQRLEVTQGSLHVRIAPRGATYGLMGWCGIRLGFGSSVRVSVRVGVRVSTHECPVDGERLGLGLG